MARDADIANRLRRYGLNVVEINGWQTRGSSNFNPRGSLDHHTAGSSNGNAPSLNICIHGRKGLSGPLCNVLVGRDNTCYVIAAGRANHAGRGSWNDLSGNSSVYGVERENTGYATGPRAEPWREDQSLVAGVIHAALMEGKNFDNVCRHAEWTSRKIDTHSINGNDLRHLVKAIAAKQAGESTPTPVPKPTPTPAPPSSEAAKFLAAIAEAARKKPVLRYKMMGETVRDLQTHLNREMNNALVVDGDFGRKTHNVLRMYQASRGLTPDGIAGFLTWSHLLAEAVS